MGKTGASSVVNEKVDNCRNIEQDSVSYGQLPVRGCMDTGRRGFER